MRSILVCLSLFLLVACGDDSPSTTTSNAEIPEQNAVKYFEALLIENDLKIAKTLVVPSKGRVLDSFASGKAASRTLYNMRFDDVKITVEDSNKNVREFYTDKADVMLIFTGNYEGGRQIEMRMVKMVSNKGKWLISEVKTDPFARPGI